MIDAVLGWHMNGATCGVAKFNHRLARELGVPCESLSSGRYYRHPLISIKAAEIGAHWQDVIPAHGDLLLHDRPPFVPAGRRILWADDIGCPSTIDGDPTRGAYRVLAFGMSSKLQLRHYENLKRQLDVEHPDYTLELSTAVHEGSPWDEAIQQSIRDMRAIFGDRLRVLGFLGDDALARTLQEVDALAVFFDPALRKNNTSAWTAQAFGKTLYTNRDEHSPSEMPTWESVIHSLTSASETSLQRSTFPDRDITRQVV